MSFTIAALVQDSISLIETGKTVAAGQAPRGIYFETEHFDNDCWYIKNQYDDPNLVYGKSTISITDRFGNFLGKKTLDHLVFRIKRSSISQQFLALSFNLRLHYYSSPSGNCTIRDISENIATRYHVQCIDLSDNNECVFYSNWNSIIRLDNNLEPLKTWKIPGKFIRQNKASSPEVRQALLLFELPPKPSIEEVKSTFHKKLLKVHPDIKRDDPYATDKTRAVIEAYEVLTRGTKNQYENELDMQLIQIKFAFEGDSVTAIQTKAGTENLFVGCYSGRLYLLERNGKSKLIYDSHAPIRKIKESGKYLYVISDYFWDILSDRILINRIEGLFRGVGFVLDEDCNAVMSNRKKVRLYSPGGIAFAEVNFRDNIADVFMHNHKLRVITGKKSYFFSIQPPTDYKMLGEGNLYLPYLL
jgi:hypothetical protein